MNEQERMEQVRLAHQQGQSLHLALLDKMPSAESIAQVAKQFNMLSNPTRLKILWMLCHCCECVSKISEMSGMSAAAVSHHLQMLRRAQLIVSHRHGKEIHYTLADTPEAEHLHLAIDMLFALRCPLK